MTATSCLPGKATAEDDGMRRFGIFLFFAVLFASCLQAKEYHDTAIVVFFNETDTQFGFSKKSVDAPLFAVTEIEGWEVGFTNGNGRIVSDPFNAYFITNSDTPVTIYIKSSGPLMDADGNMVPWSSNIDGFSSETAGYVELVKDRTANPKGFRSENAGLTISVDPSYVPSDGDGFAATFTLSLTNNG